MATAEAWPALPLDGWRDTYATFHMWTQIVGKVRLALAAPLNHWWHVVLYPTACGLTTSPMPYDDGAVQIDFDLLADRLTLRRSDGRTHEIALRPCAVADFYAEVLTALAALDVRVRLSPMPVEIPDPIRFPDDRRHASYDGDAVRRWWRILLSTAAVFEEFRGRFVGKCSPVHFFWGSFDLAVTRFSGRPAPPRPGADPVTREAYSHEVVSHGFWPGGPWVGGGRTDEPVYYAYAVPEPAGFRHVRPRPDAAFFSQQLSEFLLPYEAVRTAPSPPDALRAFLESTYEAGADLAHWDRAALERRS